MHWKRHVAFSPALFWLLILALIAGVIAIMGAHARNPSGDDVEHHDGDDAHAHASEAHAHDNHGEDAE